MMDLLNQRSLIDAEIVRQTGEASVMPVKGANGKKPRKVSANKGKPTARGDFTKKITAERADDFAAYKEANPDLKGPHLSWYKHYIDSHKEEYETFKTAWAIEHPKDMSDSETTEVASADAKPKKVLSPEHLAAMKAGREAKLAEKKAAKDLMFQQERAAVAEAPISEPTAPTAPTVPTVQAAKQPKKVAKKAAVPEPVVLQPVPVPVAVAETDPEELPFKYRGVTYIRIGISKSDGNHLWSTGDLWHSKKGTRGSYAGELTESGEINEDAEEPSLV